MKKSAGNFNQLKLKIEKAAEKAAGKKLMLQDAKEGFGEFALPCFELAKEMKKSPQAIAEDFAKKTKVPNVAAKAEGGYLNFYIDWSVFGQKLLESVDGDYGKGNEKKKALVEHTSINPNASPHVGRARNAIIGDSIVRLLKFLGYSVEVHYFVNDIGKQIAILVLGCIKKDINRLNFDDMLEIYRSANAELEKNPEMEKDAFELLSKLEHNDKETIELFRKVSSICVEGQRKILKSLNIDYDTFDYESEQVYENKVEIVMKLLEKTGRVITDNQCRKILKLDNLGLPEGCEYMVVKRSDGTSMYNLRDIGYNLDKIKHAKGGLNVVVLGEDHRLEFKQISAVMRLLSLEPPRVVHYAFILLPSGKMSTRKGEVVLLSDFMKEAFNAAFEEITRRYPELPEKEKEERAKKTSVAAVRYGIVKVSPEKNIIFNLAESLKFEGDTGPYLQYTHARANSILEKAEKIKKFDAILLKEQQEIAILKMLANYPSIVEKSAHELKPHYLAEYLHQLADAFNSFYQNIKVLKAETAELRDARLKLVEATRAVLKSGLHLLGIEALERM